MWLAGGVLALMVVASVFSSILRQRETIQYSQFKQLLAENRVDDLLITTDTIRGKYQKPDKTLETFTTVRVEDPKLVDLLEAKGVRYEAAVDNRWIAEVLAQPDSLNYMAAVVRMAVSTGAVLPELLQAFRTGGGVPWSSYGRDAREGQADINKPIFLQLIGDWFASGHLGASSIW